MKPRFKPSRIGAAAAILLGLAGTVSAQSLAADLARRPANVTHVPSGSALTAASKATPLQIVQAYLRGRGTGEATLASLRTTETSHSAGGITHVRLEQQVDGLTVHGSYIKAAINSRGELVHLIDRFAQVSASHPAPASIGAAQALAAAMSRVHPDAQATFTPLGRTGNTSSFAGGSFFHIDPTVTKVAIARTGDRLESAYLVQTWSEKRNLLNHTLVSGRGEVLGVELRTANDQYKVFTEDPGKGPQVVVPGPAPGGVESPNGWLVKGLQKTTKITGNNVEAYLDVAANNRPDRGGSAVFGGKFLTPVDLTTDPFTDSNRAVATQNLFYFNNTIHDRLYDLGFTEEAGNFQTDNLGRGGVGGDAVHAEAQDGSGTNNANFSTPPDGQTPRMQMYLWTGAGPTHQVHENSPAVADFNASPASWGAVLDTTGLTGNVVAATDAGGVSTTDGCEAIVGSLTGKIALVDRGNCNFTVKAKNAQLAGASGLLVVNNTGTNETIVMGGTDATVTIPALMVGLADGTALRKTAGLNVTLRKLAVQPLEIDASLDADVVYHEYGHGLSWRLVGGMSGPLAGAIGEGASDGLAMLMDGDDIMGEYSSSNPNGIRRYPYAGYPLTYANVTGAEVHNDGEIYAAVVWRLIELFGPTGHDTWFGYFVDGMKYTPSTPAYEDMRNGILDSISTSGGPVAHCGLVWQAFAQFGIGDGAKGVVNPDGVTVTITPSFTARTNCTH